MTLPAIRIKNLGKRYQIGVREAGYTTLREALVRVAAAPLRRLRRLSGGADEREHMWALKDVSFDVQPGEVIGIIGRNGAGKSTLLKVLSKITEPTEGRVEIRGRIASLLEVGTGFHPELTGRENIFLNGAILGMSRVEISRKFDEIVEFSEIGRYLDTPVKRYSSGMYVRLAFAVAAHLDPEILIVDEVLAVGDAGFQRKCLGKMEQVSRVGRTVLFVSHNMAAIEALCSRSVLLERGAVACEGQVPFVVARYLSSSGNTDLAFADLTRHSGRSTGSQPIIHSVELVNSSGEPASSVRMGQSLTVAVRFSHGVEFKPVLGVAVKTLQQQAVFGINNAVTGDVLGSTSVSHGKISCTFDVVPLVPGRYLIDLYLGDGRRDFDVIHNAVAFDIAEADVYSTGRQPPPTAGPVFCRASWAFETTSSD